MVYCCALAKSPFEDGRVIYETNNFFVFAGLGPLGHVRNNGEGYVLVASREHRYGSGDFSDDERAEAEGILEMTRRIVGEVYQEPCMFEHGPRVAGKGWGGTEVGCIDHAHFHFVPGIDITKRLAVNLFDSLKQTGWSFGVDRAEGLLRTAEIYDRGINSYAVYQSPGDQREGPTRYVVEINFEGVRQWMRHQSAEEMGRPDLGDWRNNQDLEAARRTVDKLANRFK